MWVMVSKRRFKLRPPHWLDDEVFTVIERELDLYKPNEKLRKQLNFSVSLYLLDRQRISPRPAEARKRLHAVNKALVSLHKQLNEDAVELAARTAMKGVTERLLEGKLAAGSEFYAAVKHEAEKLPDSKIKTYYLNFFENVGSADNFIIGDAPHKREVLGQIKRLVLREVGVDLDVIAEELDRLCQFIATLKRSKGGRPGDWAWNALMSDLAKA